MVQHVPALFRVLAVFIIILVFIRRRMSIGGAFFLGAIILGIFFGLGPGEIIRSVLASTTNPKTVSLTVVVSLILVLSHSMELAGQMQRLLGNFRGLVRSPRLNMIVFPAAIGLLPMPGGAIFSAPMVKNLGARFKLTGPQLSYINYWFRHIWEYWWPLYPGVLLTMALAQLDLWIFVMFLCPLTVIALLAGYVPLRGLVPALPENGSCRRGERTPAMPFIKELAPIIIVIIVGIGTGMVFTGKFQEFRVLSSIAKEMGLILSLLIGITWVWRQNGLSLVQRFRVLGNRQLLNMIFMVVSILVFKGILEDSLAVAAISKELIQLHIPLMPITIIVPFLVGGVSGITIAFVGTTFPVLIALINSFGESNYLLAYMMLALVSGFVGVLLSPLHLCLLLTNEYFSTGLYEVYRYLWIPCLVLLMSGSAYFLLAHAVFPF